MDSREVFMVCESQFSDVIIQVEVVSLIGLSGQGDSLSSLNLAFLNRRYITVLLTGTLSQHLLENVWYSVFGMTEFAIVKDNKLMSSLIWQSWRNFSATLSFKLGIYQPNSLDTVPMNFNHAQILPLRGNLRGLGLPPLTARELGRICPQ